MDINIKNLEDAVSVIQKQQGQIRQLEARIDALSRLTIRILDIDAAPEELTDGRSVTPTDKEKLRAAILFARELSTQREEIERLIRWFKDRIDDGKVKRESWTAWLRLAGAAILGAIGTYLGNHFSTLK